MRRAALIATAAVLAGCGGGHAKKLDFVPDSIPVYPGAAAPKIAVNTPFQSTDFTLPARTKPSAVYDWYTARLPKRGWKITQRNETGVHAEKGKRTIDVGVRGRTLEINQG